MQRSLGTSFLENDHIAVPNRTRVLVLRKKQNVAIGQVAYSAIILVFDRYSMKSSTQTYLWCGESNEAPAIKMYNSLRRVEQCLLMLRNEM